MNRHPVGAEGILEFGVEPESGLRVQQLVDGLVSTFDSYLQDRGGQFFSVLVRLFDVFLAFFGP